MVTQKIHVHGLVLHDVIAKLETTTTEETVDYLQEYFRYPLKVFKKKILHVFDGCPDIRLNDFIQEQFVTATRKAKQFIETDLQPSKQLSLIQVICQNNYIRSLGVGEANFDGIIMPKYERGKSSKFILDYSELAEAEKEMVQRRMDDETEIIEKLKYLISETDEINNDIILHQQLDIKEQVINDVNRHLFECIKTCPLCYATCNELHPGRVGPDYPHKSCCHRPKGFAGFVADGTNTFTTTFCNDDVKTDRCFRSADTNMEYCYYREYRKVNHYYNSWDIDGIASYDALYWKYITYQVTKHLNRFFLEAKQTDISAWGNISKSEAIKAINSLSHLDGNTIAKNKDGFHYIKT